MKGGNARSAVVSSTALDETAFYVKPKSMDGIHHRHRTVESKMRSERVYIVEPTGEYENDPNVTDKKFPGNLTRSYRSKEPLKIVGEVTAWVKQTPEELRLWREKLANNKGKIIN